MRTIFLIISILLSISINAQVANYDIDNTKVFVRLKKLTDQKLQLLSDFGKIEDYKYEQIRINNLGKSSTGPIDINWVVLSGNNLNIDEILNLEFVQFASFFVKTPSKSIGQTGLFYIHIKDGYDVASLTSEIEASYGINVVDLIGYKKRTLKVLLNKNDIYTVNNLVQLLESKEYIKWTQIGYLYDIERHCTDDPLFNNQWALKNTGQNGGTADVDINYCNAMDITTGNPNIIVAVVDDGVDLGHEDLVDNMIDGFDASDPDGNGDIVETVDFHGTLCAGIIGAVSNDIGITGVAPNVSIMPCRSDFFGAQANEWLGDCIDFAWENGADVISNSWQSGNNNNIEEAIENALTQGRNGLGCVVVFSSGNGGNGTIAYPASHHEDILVVGAVDRCGFRSGRSDVVPNYCDPWPSGGSRASQYGDELDVVAPGTNVLTTAKTGTGSVNDHYGYFNGTSAVAPHVAGVAALILSMNPCLTNTEVNEAIEATAQKTGSYNYATEPGRLNGDWHIQVGYGLVDAYEALLYARGTLLLQNQIDIGIEEHRSIGVIRTGNDVDPTIMNADYVVDAGADVILEATQEIKLEVGTTIKAGSNFRAFIGEFDGDCGNWHSSYLRTVPVDNPTIDDNIVVIDKSNNFNENIKGQIDVNIYPNPFENNFNLGIDLAKSEDYNLNIFNATGELIYTQNGQLDIGQHLLNIPINQGNGLCIVRLQIGDKIITKKLMKYE